MLNLSLQTCSGPAGSWQFCPILVLPCLLFLFQNSVLHFLKHSAKLHIASGLRSQTSQAYESAFCFFLAFLVFTGIVVPHAVETVVMYLEFLVVNGYFKSLFFFII